MFWVFGLWFSTYLQHIVRKIGNNNLKNPMNFHIILSNQYCNYKFRNFFQSNSRSKVKLVKDRKPTLRYVGLPRVYIHSNIVACSHWNFMVLVPVMLRNWWYYYCDEFRSDLWTLLNIYQLQWSHNQSASLNCRLQVRFRL